jgi:hypothetical protein
LGDARDRALDLFPLKKHSDQEMADGNGGSYSWVDSNKSGSSGNLFIHFSAGVVSQIDATTSRFHTSDGITVKSTPAQVRAHYKGMRAFILSDSSDHALGWLPVVYWIDYQKGIVFAFAYYPSGGYRYVYAIVVFQPNSQIRDLNGALESSTRRELPPYSLPVTQPDSR